MKLEEAYPLPPRVHERREPVGQLDFEVATSGGRSYAATQFHEGALKIMLPHYLDNSGQVYYTLLNPGGGYVGGDDYHIRVSVHKDASLLLTSQSATKVYRTPGGYAMQDMEVILGPGATFEYLPDQLIVYRGATYSQYTNVSMASTASFLTSEVVTPGWAPDGSTFGYDEVRMRTAVHVDGEPVVVDNLLLRPNDPTAAADSLLFFEDKSHLATLLAVDRRIDQQLVAQVRARVEEFTKTEATTDMLWAVTQTAGSGMAVRALGTYTEDLFALTTTVANHLRAVWRGQGEIQLRKY